VYGADKTWTTILDMHARCLVIWEDGTQRPCRGQNHLRWFILRPTIPREEESQPKTTDILAERLL